MSNKQASKQAQKGRRPTIICGPAKIYSDRPTILMLGGTWDARVLTEAVDRVFEKRFRVIYSLAGRLGKGISSRTIPGEHRVGGFGGVAGLEGFLKKERVCAIVDATHPFAATISAHAVEAAENLGIPRLTLARPPWKPENTTQWRQVESLEEAARCLPGLAKRVFLTVGSESLGAFADLPGIHLVVRLLRKTPQQLELKDYIVVINKPPFTYETDKALMEDHHIDCLVTKNAGGVQTQAKIKAAQDLGIPILAVSPPKAVPGPRVIRIEDALAWLEETMIEGKNIPKWAKK